MPPNHDDDENQERFEKRIMYEVLYHFLVQGLDAEHVAALIKERYHRSLPRTGVYRLVREGVKRKYVILSPPSDLALREVIRSFPNKGSVDVTLAEHVGVSEAVSARGAEIVLKLIKEIGKARGQQAVHLGLGIGRTSMLLAMRLGLLLEADRDVPKVVIHAIAPPHSPRNPLETPLAYFAYFMRSIPNVEFVGLDTVAVVEADLYDAHVKSKMVVDAFEQKPLIDLVVTSLASSTDPSGYLYRYIEAYGEKGQLGRLKRRGWVGDVHLRPYSTTGPIELDKGPKPVTLFELQDLVSLVKSGKHVVLLCGPSSHDSASKADALLPLLERPELAIWNHLVVDSKTAREVNAARRARHGPSSSSGSKPPPPDELHDAS